MKKILEKIIVEINQAKKDSIGTYRGGDYRIGLTKAESIVRDKLLGQELPIQDVSQRSELLLAYKEFDKGCNCKSCLMDYKSKVDKIIANNCG